MSFPNKSDRQSCWDSRDKYWQCLDSKGEKTDQCNQFRQLYEKSCPKQWVKHFDRKRQYLQFKEKIEKEGYEPLNNLN